MSPEAPAVSDLWTLKQVLDYLDVYGATVRGGSNPAIIFPPEVPETARALVLPHVKALRAELLAHFEPLPDEPEFAPPVKISPEVERKRNGIVRKEVIDHVRELAQSHQKVILFLKRSGHIVTDREPSFKKTYPAKAGKKKLKIKIPVDREATYCTFEGSSEWFALPKVTFGWEDEELAGKKRRRKRGRFR